MEAVDYDVTSPTLQAMLLPLQTDNLLIPDAMVAEIQGNISIRKIAESPDWFVGYFDWRGQEVPLISFEALNGAMAITAESVSRVAIIKTMAGHGHLPYYAVVVHDTPQILEINDDEVTVHEGRPRGRAEAISVALAGETAGIPNTDWVEQHLLTYILHG